MQSGRHSKVGTYKVRGMLGVGHVKNEKCKGWDI